MTTVIGPNNIANPSRVPDRVTVICFPPPFSMKYTTTSLGIVQTATGNRIIVWSFPDTARCTHSITRMRDTVRNNLFMLVELTSAVAGFI
jgi:hypothetical protein